MSDPYSEFPDVIAPTCPEVFIATTSYDTRVQDDRVVRHFQEQQARRLAQYVLENPKFFFASPRHPQMWWLTIMHIEAMIVTRKQWEDEQVRQYERGVIAARRMWPPIPAPL